MSGFKYPTLFFTIPLYNILIDHLEDIENNEIDVDNEEFAEVESNITDEEKEKWSLSIKEASKKCKTKLLEYYNKTNNSYLISIILDSRLKLQYYLDHEWGEQLVNDIQNKLVYYIITINIIYHDCINFVN